MRRVKDLEDILLNEVPLVKATRDLRMAAAEQIEELLAEVEREATTKLEAHRGWAAAATPLGSKSTKDVGIEAAKA